jgi:ribosomal-protein-alanine N-acetyltransferase
MEIITTSFGMLRHYQAGDAPALAKYGDNRKIWANMRDGFHSPYEEEHARAFLEGVAKQSPVTFFAIATPEELIGGIGISLGQDVHRLTAEIAYWLGEPFWGRGIVTEAVAKFSDYAYEKFGLVRIYAEPYATNLGSCRLLEKAGFTLEGRLRCSAIKEGRVIDQMMYARVKPGI